MEYKIEYTPEYVKKDLTAERIHKISGALLLAGIALFAALLWYNRDYVLYAAGALERMAVQLQEGNGIRDAVAAFYETLQGGFGG